MKKSLKLNIKKYINSNPIRLHMPGHKGRSADEQSLYKHDITELDFSDNLMNPTAEIKDLNESLAKVYGAKKAFVLVGGSSCGIVSSILSGIKDGEKILIPRNSHISAYYGLYFSGAEPIYLYPRDGSGQGEFIFRAEDYTEKIKEKSIKAVFITYPTYYGSGFDIIKLCEEIRRIDEDIIIIVDQAHGAHLNFAKREDNYPVSATAADCDIVITSIHKTLGGLNGAGALLVVSDRVNTGKIKLFLKMTQTTSPSYPVICSVEESIKEAAELGKDKLAKIKQLYIWADNELRQNSSLFLEDFGAEHKDYSKMAVSTKMSELNAYKLDEILKEKYNIYTEFADGDILLGYLGIRSNEQDVKKFVNAVIETDNEYNKSGKKTDAKKQNNYKVKAVYSIKKALSLESREVNIKKAAGKISADFIVPYPPGYPLLVPGEIISDDIAKYLESICTTHEIVGVSEDGKLKTLL